MTDARRHSESRESIGARNRSNVYSAMRKIAKPSSVSDIHSVTTGITERTVRRAIDGLIKSGHAMAAGRNGNSDLFALRDHVPMDVASRTMVPFGDGSMSPRDFLDLITSPDGEPLRQHTKRNVLSESTEAAIRQRMAFVVLTAGIPGFTEANNRYRNGLITIHQELKWLTDVVGNFVNSPLWLEDYRDKMAINIRETQKQDPELFQLAKDYIANLANRES